MQAPKAFGRLVADPYGTRAWDPACKGENKGLVLVYDAPAGTNLQRRVTEKGPIKRGALYMLALALFESLRCLHREGLVHGRLHPAGVWVGPRDAVQIEFGPGTEIAFVDSPTNAKYVKGTEILGERHLRLEFGAGPFMERITQTCADDVYAAGVLLHYVGTRRSLFSPEERREAVQDRDWQRPTFAAALGLPALVDRCLEGHASRRPPAELLAQAFA